jgi:hypothetical protein
VPSDPKKAKVASHNLSFDQYGRDLDLKDPPAGWVLRGGRSPPFPPRYFFGGGKQAPQGLFSNSRWEPNS